MISYDEFVKRLRDEPPTPSSIPAPGAGSPPARMAPGRIALPTAKIEAARQQAAISATTSATFATRLLTASGFGDGKQDLRDDVLPSTSSATRHLPDQVRYFKPDGPRQHHVVLVEFGIDGAELFRLARTLFSRQERLDLLEDALDRFAQDILDAFKRGKKSDLIPRGEPHETLCVVSVIDHRVRGTKSNHLVHFATVASNKEPALESFTIRQECVDWDKPRSDEYTKRVYERSFSVLDGPDWKRAFVREAERKQIRKLTDACVTGKADRNGIETLVVDLLNEVAGSFGLPAKNGRRIAYTQLPDEHDIGRGTEKERRGAWRPPPGVVIRDHDQRLLGYIVYCLDGVREAEKLEERLAARNRFHNVLVLYPDGDGVSVSLWQGSEPMKGRLTKAGAAFAGESRVISFLSRFFVISRAEIGTPKELAEELAHRARFLHNVVLNELDREEKLPTDSKEPRRVLQLFRDFNAALGTFEKADFANAYAETIAYGLLAARWMARDADRRFQLPNVAERLPTTSPFLRALFGRLIDIPIDGRFTWLLGDIASLLDRTSVREVFATAIEQEDHRDPVIHFYEDFLDAYDPERRRDLGVYYTPDDVVSCIVECTHSILIEEFHLPDGLADISSWGEVAERNGFSVPTGINPDAPFVCILDPATGTGTFLKKVVDVIHRTVMAKHSDKPGAEQKSVWVDYVRKHLLRRVNGFELIMAPYIVAHLRLGLTLQETGFTFEGDDRLHVYLTNTLEAPATRQLDLVAKDVAHESREADELKKSAPITVIVGNPPYDRNAASNREVAGWMTAGWDAWNGGVPPFESYTEPVRRLGAGGDLKNAYNLYVYFWRWMTLKIRELNPLPGIVSVITASSYVRGPAFRGLRQHMRGTFSLISIIDLEGDQMGTRVTENVFAIKTPVAIGFLRSAGVENDRSASVEYCVVRGTSEQKLAKCAEMKSLAAHRREFSPVVGSDVDSFEPPAGAEYKEWPPLTKVFPWSHTGAEFQRTWPIAPTKETLVARWRVLVESRTRASLFAENRDRTIDRTYPHLMDDGRRDQAISELSSKSPDPWFTRYAYRSFDRVWCIADSRVGTVLKAPLWRTVSERQVFLTSLLTGVLGNGPSAVATAYVPDKHHFRGSYGARDVIPLWRDPQATVPNINHAALAVVRKVHGASLTVQDLFAYAYAVMAHPAYAVRFHEELRTPGPRLPITKRPELFNRGVSLGSMLLRLHTFGERFRSKNDGFAVLGTARIVKPIPGDPEHYPERYRYDEKAQMLHVGDGTVAPVSKEVWDYAVSGYKVVDSWLAYRKKGGSGKKSSDLDDIRPERWTAEMTGELLEVLHVLERSISMHSELEAFLAEVVAGETFTAKELPDPTEAEQKEPKIETRQLRLK